MGTTAPIEGEIPKMGVKHDWMHWSGVINNRPKDFSVASAISTTAQFTVDSWQTAGFLVMD